MGVDRRSRGLNLAELREPEGEVGLGLWNPLKFEKAILGVFDEGCMGMYNAVVEDHLLNRAGLYKERLSQSALVADMQQFPVEEATAVRRWLDGTGMKFVTGTDEATQLTEPQILEQCKMYIAALRFALRFGCDAIGIQYHSGR